MRRGARRRRPRSRDDRGRRDQRPRLSRANGLRQHLVAAERVGEPADARDRGRHRRDEDHRAGEPDEDPSRSTTTAGSAPSRQRRSRRAARAATPCRGPSRDRPGRRRARPARSGTRSRRPRRCRRRGSAEACVRARASRRRSSRPSRGPCRRASPRRGRRRGRASVGAVPSSMPWPRSSSEKRSGRPSTMSTSWTASARPATRSRAGRGSAGGRGAPRRRRRSRDPPRSRPGSVRRVPAERVPHVVRHEERRERDHDQVVEEEHPAGEEPERVVERAADEGRAPPVSGIAATPSA